MDRKEVELLFKKYLSGKCTPTEKSWVESWYIQYSKDQEKSAEEIDLLLLEQEIYDQLPKPQKIVRMNFRYAVSAAIVLLALSYGMISFFQATKDENIQLASHEIEIIPGGNKAFLTLADGQVIDLESDKSGIVILNNGLSYNDGTIIQNASQVEGSFNTISVPKGGQYQITLSDGTKVWLNSASSLKYPSAFNEKERQVELEGEAYFEVAKAQSSVLKLGRSTPSQPDNIPFFVKTRTQEIEVLGTHFNVNAYENENSTKTTLLEGSVKVSVLKNKLKSSNTKANHDVILYPNQQSLLRDDGEVFQVNSIDPSLVMSWKEGLFSFKDSDLKSMMRQFERWYDVEVSYEGNIPQISFSGKIHRSEKIEKLYGLLAYYKINYEVEGRHIKIVGK